MGGAQPFPQTPPHLGEVHPLPKPHSLGAPLRLDPRRLDSSALAALHFHHPPPPISHFWLRACIADLFLASITS